MHTETTTQAAPPTEQAGQGFYRRFLASVERWPQAVAVEMQRQGGATETYTYSELRGMAESLAGWLQRNGMPAGERCAILAHNGPRWVAAHLGIIAAGGVSVPFDTALRPEQVATLLQNSGASVLFVDARTLAAGRRAAEGLEVQLVLLEKLTEQNTTPECRLLGGPAEFASLPDMDAMLAAGPRGFTPAAVQPGDLAVLVYTSGTTSDPKGVMLTHDNLLAEIEAVFGFIDITPTDAILGVLPLFHVLAQMANLLLPFAGGARVVYLESLNTTELMRALQERNITVFCCVPQFFYLIHERIQKQVAARGLGARLAFRVMMSVARAGRALGLNPGKLLFRPVHRMLGPRMRYFVTGGSRFDPGVGRDLQTLGFEVLQAYGLTETSGGACVTWPQDNVLGSVGKPLPGVEIKLHEAEASEEAGGRPVGEILIRGRIVMKGYYQRPDATAEALRDGWLHTGDLGMFDEGGHLFVTGRRKDVIVLASGKNVYPEEIEAHYLQSPFIKELCVLGLESRPGEPFSERLHGVVVPDFELLRERKIANVREVVRFDIETLSASLPSTKRLLSFDLWQEELPRTTTRKLKRFEIRDRVLQAQAEGGDAVEAGALPPREPTEEERAWMAEPDVARALGVVRQAVKDRERRERVQPGSNLELDLGLDSMERVELLVALERELGASVKDSLASEVYTVREMVEAVRAHRTADAPRMEAEGWDAILATESDDPDVRALEKSRPISGAFWYVVSRLAAMFARDRFRLRVRGLEKLPQRGPFILCPNHQSFLDAPIVASVLPWDIFKDAFHLGTTEIFGEGFWRHVARSVKLIPVDPDASLIPGMRAGAFGLRRGKVLVLYPEGERSIDGAPRVFKKGAAILALHLQVPLVPVAVDGFYEAWPRGKGFQKFAPLGIAFGEPILPPKDVGNPDVAYTQLTAELKARVMELWEPLHEELYGREEQAKAAD